MIGTRLSHYEITSHLGTGGMGEVYQATDMKLGRKVAIKRLPAAFASDPDHLSRFRREAQVLASLNHPNSAHVYGLEESGETRCIVMELVEGETLHERIQQGPLPVDLALSIAKQIAEALPQRPPAVSGRYQLRVESFPRGDRTAKSCTTSTRTAG